MRKKTILFLLLCKETCTGKFFEKRRESPNSVDSITLCELVVHLEFAYLFQRDLDFSIDVDFRGELSELVESYQYKMR